MKKIIALLLCMLLAASSVVVMTSCNDSANNASVEDDDDDDKKKDKDDEDEDEDDDKKKDKDDEDEDEDDDKKKDKDDEDDDDVSYYSDEELFIGEWEGEYRISGEEMFSMLVESMGVGDLGNVQIDDYVLDVTVKFDGETMKAAVDKQQAMKFAADMVDILATVTADMMKEQLAANGMSEADLGMTIEEYIESQMGDAMIEELAEQLVDSETKYKIVNGIIYSDDEDPMSDEDPAEYEFSGEDQLVMSRVGRVIYLNRK